MAVMSHGNRGVIYGMDTERVRINSRCYFVFVVHSTFERNHLNYFFFIMAFEFYLQVPIDDEIVKSFDSLHCPALSGKPKIFLIQACQGGMYLCDTVTQSKIWFW